MAVVVLSREVVEWLGVTNFTTHDYYREVMGGGGGGARNVAKRPIQYVGFRYLDMRLFCIYNLPSPSQYAGLRLEAVLCIPTTLTFIHIKLSTNIENMNASEHTVNVVRG